MIIIPAIDLKGGKVVRLIKGDFSEQLVYGEDPVSVALKWVKEGAERLHVVDLDGALTGIPKHVDVITKIAASVPVPIQTGGGIRTMAAIAKYLDAGVAQVILGTKACLDESFVTKSLKNYGDRIAAAVDVKDGRVAVEGWVRKEWIKPEPLVGRLVKQGIKTIIYTDTTRDGTMTGPVLESFKEILNITSGTAACIASGGIGSIEDILKLKTLEPAGLTGIIVGRALYEGRIDLKKAVEACLPKGSSPVSTSKTAASSKGCGSSS